MIIADPKTREEWLTARQAGLGGSDAACIVDMNPWKSARQLFKEKTGMETPSDISGKPVVQFGKNAERHIRELFLLEHPELTCEYHEFRMYANDRYPYIYATLDGELAKEKRRGILEIKTTTIHSSQKWQSWNGRIPQNYYVQILHQFLACEWAEFAVLYAYIRLPEHAAKLQEYWIERREVQADMHYLLTQEVKFWYNIQNGEMPPDILPEI